MVAPRDGDRSRQRILSAISRFSAEHEYSPTVRQIAELVGLSTNPVHKHLVRLVKDGKVLRPPRPGVGWRLTSEGLLEALRGPDPAT